MFEWIVGNVPLVIGGLAFIVVGIFILRRWTRPDEILEHPKNHEEDFSASEMPPNEVLEGLEAGYGVEKTKTAAEAKPSAAPAPEKSATPKPPVVQAPVEPASAPKKKAEAEPAVAPAQAEPGPTLDDQTLTALKERVEAEMKAKTEIEKRNKAEAEAKVKAETQAKPKPKVDVLMSAGPKFENRDEDFDITVFEKELAEHAKRNREAIIEKSAGKEGSDPMSTEDETEVFEEEYLDEAVLSDAEPELSADDYSYKDDEPEIEIAESSSEKVEFAVFSQTRVTPESSFILDVWAFFPHQYADITQMAETLGREKVLGRKSGVPVQRGSLLTIRTEIPGLHVPEPNDAIVWDGSPSNASFIVSVPQGVKPGSYPGKVLIGFQGLTIAKIVFMVTIAPEAQSEYADHSQKTEYPRTAFASYASENRGEVLSRIQGMQKIAPNLDVFVDVFSLRSGQNWLDKLQQHVPSKDIFYLFWSQSAAGSEWVEREWRMALEKRGMNYIDPVPLEEPDRVPPPQELAKLHFNDAYVAYIAYEKLKKQMENQP